MKRALIIAVLALSACGPGPLSAAPDVGARCDTSAIGALSCSPDAGQMLSCEDGGAGAAYWALRMDCPVFAMADGGAQKLRCSPEPTRNAYTCG